MLFSLLMLCTMSDLKISRSGARSSMTLLNLRKHYRMSLVTSSTSTWLKRTSGSTWKIIWPQNFIKFKIQLCRRNEIKLLEDEQKFIDEEKQSLIRQRNKLRWKMILWSYSLNVKMPRCYLCCFFSLMQLSLNDETHKLGQVEKKVERELKETLLKCNCANDKVSRVLTFKSLFD